MEAEVNLQPFSLIVGANGSGKSNLLKFFGAISGELSATDDLGNDLVLKVDQYQGPFKLKKPNWVKHQNALEQPVGFEALIDGSVVTSATGVGPHAITFRKPWLPWQGKGLTVFNIDPDKVSAVETAIPFPSVTATGEGTAQVLDSLKNGDREDLFDKIEDNFRRYVPEVEKLSLRTVDKGKKQIQVREKGLNVSTLATELSEGTRLILCILTILHQETPPPVILLEDIDRGMHPRLFEYIAPLMRDIAKRNQINILATTHNPYLVDCFQDYKDSVIIVEKKDGISTLTTLNNKLEWLDYETVDPEDMPLGSLWYSGLIGGTPKNLSREVRH
ncbi:MAG: protein putative AbiEii toxin, Type system [Chthoniobacteraceae bacterium]|nr:protein putative AbiEii toxin, Type system [Chthoniobacteraceae bacterium]